MTEVEQVIDAQPGLAIEAALDQVCERIGRECDVDPPVAIEIVASACGIARIDYVEQPFDGFLFGDPTGRLVAQVRLSDSYTRQRFTIGHEAGHPLVSGYLGASLGAGCDLSALTDVREERLANRAAAEFLLPRRFFVKDQKLAQPGLDGIEELAEHYEVGLHATALRSVQLSPRPAALIVLRLAHKPTERGRELECPPRLRVQWSAQSEHPWGFVLRHKSISDRSILHRAWSGVPLDEVGLVDELFNPSPGPVRVRARRYGQTLVTLLTPTRREP